MSPDGSTKPPPEEKLLRLIRGKSVRPEGGADRSAASAKRFTRIGVGSALTVRTQGLPWSKVVMIGFGVVVAVEAIGLAVQLMRPPPEVRIPAMGSLPPVEPSSLKRPLDALPSLASSASRPLFAVPVEVSTAPSASHPRTSPSSAAKMLASRLSLMGIVAGEPAQAIIEDAQTRKSYFVATGQAVVEGAILEQVLDNRVILDLDGEKIELTL